VDLGRIAGIVALIVVLMLAPAVPTAANAGGDAAAGGAKSLACAACHVAPDPRPDPRAEAPYLAGQREGYLAAQLAAFRRGDRAHPLMDVIARQLSDADIADLAAFWSHQPAGSDTRPSRAADAIKRSRMTFPAGFPAGFVLYLTLNDAEHHTIKRHYVNAIGLEAARANRPPPPGSVVLQVNCLARLGPDQQPVRDPGGAWIVDKIFSYTAMETRAGWGKDIPALLRNADWSYGTFTPDRAPSRDANQAVCLACHKAQAAVGYLFTFNELRDRAHDH
jgi:cytochrome c553